MFTAHFCIQNSKNWFYAFVREEENIVVKGLMYDKDQYNCASASAVVLLQEHERLWVECRSDPGADVLYDATHYMNSFSGSLLHVIRE